MNERKRDSPRLPPLGNIAAVVGVLAVVAGTGWYLFIRDGGTSSGSNTTTGRTVPSKTTTQPKPASSSTEVPATAPDLEQPKSAYTILVLNGSGVAGAAANMVPLVEAKGWNTAKPDNASSDTETTSFVMYLPDKEAVADNLAIDLGVTKKLPVDGVTITQDTSAVDAILVVGKDLATSRTP